MSPSWPLERVNLSAVPLLLYSCCDLNIKISPECWYVKAWLAVCGTSVSWVDQEPANLSKGPIDWRVKIWMGYYEAAVSLCRLLSHRGRGFKGDILSQHLPFILYAFQSPRGDSCHTLLVKRYSIFSDPEQLDQPTMVWDLQTVS